MFSYPVAYKKRRSDIANKEKKRKISEKIPLPWLNQYELKLFLKKNNLYFQ